MNAIAMVVGLIQADEGLTFREVITDIPHDPAAIVVYALLAVSVWAIWRGSRGGQEDDATGKPVSGEGTRGAR